MSMVEVKTSELIGAALDWAVGIAEGNPMERPASDVVWSKYHGAYNPSTDWSQGGPLIDEYKISTVKTDSGWFACDVSDSHWIDTTVYDEEWRGETALIAACRAIVAAKLGDAVSVPSDLL